MKTLEKELIKGFSGDLFSGSDLNRLLETALVEEIQGLRLNYMYNELEEEIGKSRAFKRIRFLVRETESYLNLRKPRESGETVAILKMKESEISSTETRRVI